MFRQFIIFIVSLLLVLFASGKFPPSKGLSAYAWPQWIMLLAATGGLMMFIEFVLGFASYILVGRGRPS